MATESDFTLSRAAVSFADLGHCQLAYRQVGSGPPLILVHGYPLSGLTFRYLVPGLADRFTCYVPDLPGLGETRWTDRLSAHRNGPTFAHGSGPCRCA